MKKIAVIGAGASGMTAAIAAARTKEQTREHWQIYLLDHKDLPGKKILSTGNGRCNLSNEHIDIACFHSRHPEVARQVLDRFSFRETLDFFSSLGLLTKSRGGYIYPRTDQAAAVRSLLEMELKRWKIPVHTGVHVEEIQRNGDHFQITGLGKRFFADRVILAAGGRAAPILGSDGTGYRLAKSLGHTLVPVVPALVPLKVRSHPLVKAAGVRTEAAVTAVCSGKETAKDRGELQITAYGISGIPVFQISRHIAQALEKKEPAEVRVDLAPWAGGSDLRAFFKVRAAGRDQLSSGEFLTGVFHQKLIPRILELAGIRMNTQVKDLSAEILGRLARVCKNVRLTIEDTTGFDNAQVSAGGIPLSEIDGRTMESRRSKGLYLAGEILDVDGICGGYNLQWAWASGYLAGTAAVKSLHEEQHQKGTNRKTLEKSKGTTR